MRVVEIVPRRESHGVQSPNFYSCVILCHCTLAAALNFEQSSCDELMEFKQIQTKAQPEESLKHNHSCTIDSVYTLAAVLYFEQSI